MRKVGTKKTYLKQYGRLKNEWEENDVKTNRRYNNRQLKEYSKDE